MSSLMPCLSYGYNQVSTRVVNLCSAGWQTYKTGIFAARAVIDAAADLATFGSNATHRALTVKKIGTLNYEGTVILTTGFLPCEIATTYITWLKVLNPSAKIEIPSDEKIVEQFRNIYKQPFPRNLTYADVEKIISRRARIFFTPPVLKGLAIKQLKMMDYLIAADSHWINRNITARMAAPLSALAMVVAGAVCTAFGVLAAVVSFITGGLSERVNSHACQYLPTPAWMLNQLHQGLLGIVRPDLV